MSIEFPFVGWQETKMGIAVKYKPVLMRINSVVGLLLCFVSSSWAGAIAVRDLRELIDVGMVRVVAVGINQSQNEKFALRFAVADAMAVGGGGGWRGGWGGGGGR